MPVQSPPDKLEFNLEHFLKNLTLQPMVHSNRAPPMPGRKARSTMMPLTMKPGGYRKLQEIKRVEALHEEATFFFDTLNAEVDDGKEFTTLSLSSQISSEKMKEILLYNPYEVNDRHEVLFAVERGPVMSAETLVHTIDEELQSWRFHTPRRNGTLNNQGIEPMYFTKLDESHGMDSVKCIVISLAPWEFTPQDFEDFTCMSVYTDGNKSTNGERNSPPWRNADKMWAYLHDLCIINDCRHFVLTTYEQWAFGGFSTYCTTAFVSDAISWDTKPNSILEIFTYWLLTACSFRETIMLHEVSEDLVDWGYTHEASCAVSHLLEVGPEVVMTLYYVPRERHIDSDIFEKERQLYAKRLPNEDLPPDFEFEQSRPIKRARKDPIEERVGWEPLYGHVSTRFPSPKKVSAHRWDTARHCRPTFTSAKPSLRWNGWQTSTVHAEKENSSTTVEDKDRGEQKQLPHKQEFGHPLLCFSMDMDHERDCFRPELISLRSSPKSSP